MTAQKDDLFDKGNIPQSNWFKMEKVGDRIKGEVVDIFEQEASGQFAPQIVLGLKQENDEVLNFGFKKFKADGVTPSYLATRAKNVKLGDIVGFEFKEEIPAKVKGYAPAKSIEIYVKHVQQPAKSFEDLEG